MIIIMVMSQKIFQHLLRRLFPQVNIPITSLPMAICFLLYFLGCPHHHQSIFPPPQYNGVWSPWKEWGRCSVTCGVGVQIRHRKCTTGLCHGDEDSQRTCVKVTCNPGKYEVDQKTATVATIMSSKSLRLRNFTTPGL